MATHTRNGFFARPKIFGEMELASLRRTPLYQRHHQLNARFIAFAGYEMPVHYGSILNETIAVRKSVGLFDVSHMGRLFLSGPTVVSDLDRLVTVNVSPMAPGKVRYGFLCRSDGGILDDLTVFRMTDDQFLLVVNCATRQKDSDHISQYVQSSTLFWDQTEQTFMIAVQGPDALFIADSVTDSAVKPSSLRRFSGASFTIEGRTVWITRTGYTGEDGVEIIGEGSDAETIWDIFLSRNAVPVGLGARDILRLEAGLCLYGHDLTEEITPLEADLMRFVDLSKDFIGRDAIVRRMEEGPKSKRIGLLLDSRSSPRHNTPILREDIPIGIVTSGTFSPHTNSGIAMGYVSTEWAREGVEVSLLIRQQPCPARIVPMPFLPLPSRKSS